MRAKIGPSNQNNMAKPSARGPLLRVPTEVRDQQGEMMSKSKTASRNSLVTRKRSKRKAFFIAGLAFSLMVASGALAYWGGIFSAGQKQITKSAEATPQNMSPSSPSKEYVYAGSRLIATEEPSGSPSCSFSIAPTSRAIGAVGGTGSVTVTVSTGCNWIATSNAQWLHITSGATGSGNGSVAYSVDPNSGAPRNGTLTIAGQTFTVNQDGSTSCSYSISPANQNFTSAGGSGNVSVTAGAGCSWTASSNDGWITVPFGSGGTGNGGISYSVAANSGPARNGTMAIAGQTFTVTQDAGGSSCNHSISPTNASFGAGGGSGSINVTAGAGCSWTASSNATWITVPPGSGGTGNGSISYSVSANTAGPRSGTITVAGQTFTVNQNAGGAPPAPTNLTATITAPASIRLDWSFIEDGISIFKIERKTGTGGTYSQIGSANNGARSFSNTKLSARTTYCYRVRAYNGQDGPYSNEACRTTP